MKIMKYTNRIGVVCIAVDCQSERARERERERESEGPLVTDIITFN